MKKLIFFLTLTSFFLGLPGNSNAEIKEENKPIEPYSENSFYWQYKGRPVLLLGATDNDNLFQNNNLESHLDSLKAIGGNYIRNTMSDRGKGNQRAFVQHNDGKYDLNKWNDVYWERFETMLQLAKERDIIVQIEIWDRFDHSRHRWLSDPYNPANNMNYTYAEAGLDSLYPSHPNLNQQPFFFTVPELNNKEILLTYQNAFVKKMLSHSLKYNNILYCIDNETSGAEEWALYWRNFIIANSNGKKIFITQMWNNWDVKTDIHKRTIDHPEKYGFIDLSQNSHLPGRPNWDNPQYVFNYIKNHPRPVNSTKIYGSDSYQRWLKRGMTTEHAVQTFFRNILGGFASSRFHRPPAGLGMSQIAINSIKTIRKIEEHVKMWEITPRMDLLNDTGENTAYLSANEEEKYVVYFPKGGQAILNLSNADGQYIVRWIHTDDAEWGTTETIKGGDPVVLDAQGVKSCFAIILKKVN